MSTEVAAAKKSRREQLPLCLRCGILGGGHHQRCPTQEIDGDVNDDDDYASAAFPSQVVQPKTSTRIFRAIEKKRKRAEFHLSNLTDMINKDYEELARVAQATGTEIDAVVKLLTPLVFAFGRTLGANFRFELPVSHATTSELVAKFGLYLANYDPDLYLRAMMVGSSMLIAVENWVTDKTERQKVVAKGNALLAAALAGLDKKKRAREE